MRSILAVDGGTYFHHFAYSDPQVARHIRRRVHVRKLAEVNLADFDVVILPCRMDPDLMAPLREPLLAYLGHGGTVVSLSAEGAEEFLPGVKWSPSEVNFWWWLDQTNDPGIRISRPHHPLFRFIGAADVVWHHHGVLTPPPGAVPLVEVEGKGALVYVDRVSTPGRLVVSTLDPVFHHGSNFMPAATRMLYGMMRWLAEGDLGDTLAPTVAPLDAVTRPRPEPAEPPARCCA